MRSLATELDASTARLTAELHATGLAKGESERMMADEIARLRQALAKLEVGSELTLTLTLTLAPIPGQKLP